MTLALTIGTADSDSNDIPDDVDALARLARNEFLPLVSFYETELGSTQAAIDYLARILVDNVLNRMASDSTSIYGGTTIQGVINHPAAYSGVTAAGGWENLDPTSSAWVDAVKTALTDRVSGEDSKIGAANEFLNPTINSPWQDYDQNQNGINDGWEEWGQNMNNKKFIGSSPFDENGNLRSNVSNTTVIGNANGLRPDPYTVSYDVDEDGTIETGETSPVFPFPRVPQHKPDVPNAAGEETDSLNPGGSDDDGETLEEIFMEEILDSLEEGTNAISPLVLDLDGDGIELTNLNSAACVYWDIDADGMAEASGWVGADDGLLAIDANEDGIINDHTELFGNQTGFVDGFAALASYDLNHDWLINAEDAVWDSLIVWKDTNQNGYSEETELYTLADLDILSINLNASIVSQTIAGNPVTLSSSYTYDTGSGTATRTIVDAWFRYSDVNTVYNQDFVLDMHTTGLPGLRGYGALPTLQIAMSLDNDGGGNLFDLVSDFNALDLDDIFTDDSTAIDDVRDILFRWAGVDGVAVDSRGPNIDARELGFLEAMMGQEYRQLGFYEDPYYFAAQPLKEAFNIALDNFAARLIAQVVGNDLFEGDFYYDIASDSFDGVTGLNLTTLGDLETLAGSQTNKDIFWKNIVRVIDGAVGIENLSGGDETALDDAIYDSDNTLSLTIIQDALEWDGGTVTTWTGTAGVDTHTGGSGMDTMNGGNSGDTLNGGTGFDRVNGEGGDDILDGQGGDDYLQGGTGNDTYKYTAGQGWETFEEYGPSDLCSGARARHAHRLSAAKPKLHGSRIKSHVIVATCDTYIYVSANDNFWSADTAAACHGEAQGRAA